MAGWNLKRGVITDYDATEEQYRSLFNYVLSEACRKRNTYKFGLIKSILDNLFNGEELEQGILLSYEQLFEKFAENYWNLVVKYDLRQMRRDGRSQYSKIETILRGEAEKEGIVAEIEYDLLDDATKERLAKSVTSECKKYVIGALYEDFDGILYSFDQNGVGLCLAPRAYRFMLKYKIEIEKLNYYSWAKFLETINTDDAIIRVIEKLELATPKRSNLSVYRELLQSEFEESNCFYCGKKLRKSTHVDHFIPWSFTKDDKVWNLVLSCPTCNIGKSNRIPSKALLNKLMERNRQFGSCANTTIQKDFQSYEENKFKDMWNYAKNSGFKEMD